MYTNRILFQTFRKHSFKTAMCDSMGNDQVLNAHDVLQRLIFVHCQRFLVGKSRSKQRYQGAQGQTRCTSTGTHAFSQCGYITNIIMEGNKRLSREQMPKIEGWQ